MARAGKYIGFPEILGFNINVNVKT